MAQRLYANIHSTGSSAAATVSSPTTTTTTTTQSTPLPLASSDSPHLNTTTAMVATTTTTANNGQVTTTSASNSGLVVPHSSNSQLQPHHLANLLCQAALQLSGNLSHVLPQLQLPTETLMATAQATTSNQPHPPQQEDQFSEASALILTNPSAGTPIPTTITRNPPPLHTTLDSTSSLPPVPARLCERIIAGEFIDFNTLLTGAMFPTRDSPTLHQSPAAPQFSPKSNEFHATQTPATIKKINSFALWMEAWNVYASTLLSANPKRALKLIGYQRLITSANLQLPLSSWMLFNIRFRILAASNPALHWDIAIRIYGWNV